MENVWVSGDQHASRTTPVLLQRLRERHGRRQSASFPTAHPALSAVGRTHVFIERCSVTERFIKMELCTVLF